MASKVEHQNEESNSKGKKVIVFKANNDNVGGETSSKDENDDMVLSTRKRWKLQGKKTPNSQRTQSHLREKKRENVKILSVMNVGKQIT